MLPERLIADTLNLSFRKEARGYAKRKLRSKRVPPRMHVSSLIKSQAGDRFCAREFVLHYAERRDLRGNGVPPKFQLLYDTGHFLGDYVVAQFLQRAPEYAHMAWGDWVCVCGETRISRARYDKNAKCPCCNKPVNVYQEVDIFNKAKTVIGHADLIMLDDDGVFHIYEFKSIDRADVVFADIDRPLGDHHVQASNYYYMLREEGKNVSRMIRFVYIDRSMTEIYKSKPYREVSAPAIPRERLAFIYKRAHVVTDALATKMLPSRICTSITCTRANNCRVAISCFERKSRKFRVLP
ncbi:Cas4 family exonuclease [Rhodobacter phage RcDurkin]|nr:Cas4 family exonuclease [Rhodobacter phage RcDurkin]